jgi:hypothetical protein
MEFESRRAQAGGHFSRPALSSPAQPFKLYDDVSFDHGKFQETMADAALMRPDLQIRPY